MFCASENQLCDTFYCLIIFHSKLRLLRLLLWNFEIQTTQYTVLIFFYLFYNFNTYLTYLIT